jgi:transposase
MIRLPDEIYVATEPVSMHLSFDRLAGLVRSKIGGEPRGEAAFVFHNRRGTLLKILWFDGTGPCIFYKRLDRNVYRIPLAIPAGATTVLVSRRELTLLLAGIDRRTLRQARRAMRAKPKRGKLPVDRPADL